MPGSVCSPRRGPLPRIVSTLAPRGTHQELWRSLLNIRHRMVIGRCLPQRFSGPSQTALKNVHSRIADLQYMNYDVQCCCYSSGDGDSRHTAEAAFAECILGPLLTLFQACPVCVPVLPICDLLSWPARGTARCPSNKPTGTRYALPVASDIHLPHQNCRSSSLPIPSVAKNDLPPNSVACTYTWGVCLHTR